MILRPDARHFEDRRESSGSCRKCGCRLVFLPDDKRKGFCFECYDPYEVGSYFFRELE
ncbi:MAG: hypothetical protein ACE5KV_04465 [Thermoplasmata archaeon]